MNTNSVENIILELDQISHLYDEILTVERNIHLCDSDKNTELDKTKRSLTSTINKTLIAFKEEQLRQLPECNVFSLYSDIPHLAPIHWEYSWSKPDLKDEKSLDAFSSPEMKEQFYNAFREYEKSFVKIMKICEKKAKEEWDAYHTELAAIDAKYNQKKEEFVAKENTLKTEMNKYTVIDSSLFYIAEKISSILKQKRADSLKEAINLALDEYQKEMERFERQLHDEKMERLAEEEAHVKKEQAAAAQYQADVIKATIEAQCDRCIKRLFCSHGLNRPLNCKDFERR